MIEDVTVLEAETLALIAWADGQFDPAEKSMFVEFLENSPACDQTREHLANLLIEAPTADEVYKKLAAAPPAIVLAVTKVAYLLAMEGDHFDEPERAIFDRIAQKLGVPEEKLDNYYKMLHKYYESYQIEQSLFM